MRKGPLEEGGTKAIDSVETLRTCLEIISIFGLYLDVFFFVHGPTLVVGNDESLPDHVLDSVFEYERVLYH